MISVYFNNSQKWLLPKRKIPINNLNNLFLNFFFPKFGILIENETIYEEDYLEMSETSEESNPSDYYENTNSADVATDSFSSSNVSFYTL